MEKEFETLWQESLQGPIIQSFLDTDQYKATMAQFALHRHPGVPVKYAFKNRTKKVKLAEVIDERDLRRELDNFQTLKPTQRELEFLARAKNNDGPLYKEDYLRAIANPNLPNYNLQVKAGEFELTFPGAWENAIYWETPALAIMNELYYRVLMKKLSPEQRQAVYQEGKRRLEEKIDLLEANPDILFMEFGTRRRFSRLWQQYAVKRFKERIPKQMIGTSNISLAMQEDLESKGTMAHETFMVLSGIMHGSDDEIRASHNQVLQEWWQEYGKGLSIALTDTYGSEFFFEDMNQKQAEDWIGLRQDSGNPSAFGKRQIRFYQEKDIDPKVKLFVPSDGLDVPKMINIQQGVRGRIRSSYGYGTNATNDLGFDPLSMVIKAAEANGHGTVKLSDNPAKSMGSPKDLARFMKIFRYDPTKYQAEECRY